MAMMHESCVCAGGVQSLREVGETGPSLCVCVCLCVSLSYAHTHTHSLSLLFILGVFTEYLPCAGDTEVHRMPSLTLVVLTLQRVSPSRGHPACPSLLSQHLPFTFQEEAQLWGRELSRGSERRAGAWRWGLPGCGVT